jgi:hypothetical protein
MTLEQTTPRTRRAVLAGALGGLVASAASFVHAPAARAGVDGDLVLEASNDTSATTTLNAPTVDKALTIVGGATGVRVLGDIAVDAIGGSIAVNAIATTGAALGVVGWWHPRVEHERQSIDANGSAKDGRAWRRGAGLVRPRRLRPVDLRAGSAW